MKKQIESIIKRKQKSIADIIFDNIVITQKSDCYNEFQTLINEIDTLQKTLVILDNELNINQ